MNKFLAVAVSAVLTFAVVGCNSGEKSPTNTGNDNATSNGNLTYVGTTGGVCSKNALSKSRSSQESPVDIITTADSIRVRTEISFYCATPFTTECTISGKTVSMKINDVRERTDYVAACDCNYPFEFQFARTGDVDYNYIVEFVSPLEGKSKTIAEGTL